jgi:hypothetical protein
MNYEGAKILVQEFLNAAFESKHPQSIRLTDENGKKHKIALALEVLVKNELQSEELAFWQATFLALLPNYAFTSALELADKAVLAHRERIMKGISNELQTNENIVPTGSD